MKKESYTPDISTHSLPSIEEIEQKLPNGVIIAVFGIPDKIGGVGASGETTIAKKIAEILNAKRIEVGPKVREATKTIVGDENQTEGEYAQTRENLTDDQLTAINLLVDSMASKEANKIVERDGVVVWSSKIGPILLDNTDHISHMDDPEGLVISIAIDANQKVRDKRMRDRQITKGEIELPKNIFHGLLQLWKIRKERKSRRKIDEKGYGRDYPDVPCLKSYTRESALPHADIIIDNSKDRSDPQMDELALDIIKTLAEEIPQLLPIFLNASDWASYDESPQPNTVFFQANSR